MQEQAAAIILAAGAGRYARGGEMLWASLCGRSVVARTIDVFQASPLIAHIILVTDSEHMLESATLCKHEGWHKVAAVVAGGTRRVDCINAGIEALERIAPDSPYVMIHDGARPFVTTTLLIEGLEAAREHQAVVAAVPVKDTVKQVEQGRIHATLDRSQLWSIQTPQIFSFPLIRQLYQTQQAREEDVSDATILLTRMGQRGTIFPGSYSNIKITTQEELLLAEALLQEFSTR
jgi:2-C-methyl-D-erythritol 4-phosphate cytidylyltransferase